MLNRRILTDIASASGLELLGDQAWVISDDAVLLYAIDPASGAIVTTVTLYVPADGQLTGLQKKQKPDFEALASFTENGRTFLLACGSGSKKTGRDSAFIVDATAPHSVARVSLTPLYNALRARPDVVGGDVLNIEAATVVGNEMWLFQRGNISGVHACIRYDLAAFLACLRAPGRALPTAQIVHYALPTLGDVRAGFSAATTARVGNDEIVVFAASLENTSDAVDDGKMLGSYVGILPRAGGTVTCGLVTQDGAPFLGKIEGVAALPGAAHSSIDLIAVTDTDGGASELLHLHLST